MKQRSWVLLLVIGVITCWANIGCSKKSPGLNPDQRKPPNPKEIPLVMGRVLLPDFNERGAHGKPSERLDQNTEFAPADDVTACLTGAKLAGKAAGYEFNPVHILKEGERPRDVIGRMDTKSDLFLLVRVSSRTADFGKDTGIFVFGDAALYQKATMTPIVDAGFSGIEKADQTQITNGEVHEEYWAKTIATQFARNFDRKFLSKMQSAIDSQEITESIDRLSKVISPDLLTPSVFGLEGGEERKPEFSIMTSDTGTKAIAYLRSEDNNGNRRWTISKDHEVDVIAEQGKYTLYIEIFPEAEGSSLRVYCDQIQIEFKKRYIYRLP